MTHIVIDGYNYMMRILGSQAQNTSLMDIPRRALLERLSRYKRQKGARITVVFDAYNSLSPGRQRENYLGIDVVYSKENETADDVIIGWIREGRPNMVVVTSDRAILDEAKSRGIAFITPQRLEETMAADVYGTSDLKDDEADEPHEKKGNPRKLPKKLRRVTKTIGKIK
jgi:predicted RNA-binding protein with PIN domain